MADDRTTLQRLWAVGCSLKLAIYAASAATLLIMGGSLAMNAHPRIFGGMDGTTINAWFAGTWPSAPQLTWWLPLTALCLLIFGINTLCCLLDWLTHLRARWRKTGEYLIHTGFLLLLIGYAWGNLAGFRSGPHRLAPGETLALPQLPGYSLQLDSFTPDFSPEGRPLDMVSAVVLLRNGNEVARGTVRINHPLLHDGLVILATSLDQRLAGFRCFLNGVGTIDLAPGSRVALPDGGTLGVLQLLADARQAADGQVIPMGEQLGNPALQLLLLRPDGSLWQGWYFLREPPPFELAAAGAAPRPLQPLAGYVSLLTVNRDPGAGLALAGGICLTIGVLLAMLSFYRKRRRGDRPQI
ncbi:MAG: cytochrome c biogenesis protein ResB [Desulfuromonas sp.]|nr:cytochrome c biogenesis protein ResB [Desulfuromonas sp.]